MNPITRVEMFLNAAAGNEQALPDPVTREEVFLKAIVEAQSGGGGGLPSVSDADNGKVLTVVDGAWSPADSGSSGGGVLVVHQNADTGALDKTWQEIHDAPFSVMYVAGDEGSAHAPIVATEVDGSDYRVFVLIKDGEVLGYLPAVTDSANGYPVVQED